MSEAQIVIEFSQIVEKHITVQTVKAGPAVFKKALSSLTAEIERHKKKKIMLGMLKSHLDVILAAVLQRISETANDLHTDINQMD